MKRRGVTRAVLTLDGDVMANMPVSLDVVVLEEIATFSENGWDITTFAQPLVSFPLDLP